MKIRAAVFCLAVAACAIAQQVPKKVYRVETSDPKDIRMEVVHGETINLQWTFLSYANPLDIESAAVTLHARTNGMAEGVSFQVPGVAGPGGVATVRLAVSEWLPASVSEAEWTLEVVQPDAARILRAKGTVTATRSAAASASGPVPVVWLDDIRAEIDAAVATGAPVQSVNGKTGEVWLGAADVGAVAINGGTANNISLTGTATLNGVPITTTPTILVDGVVYRQYWDTNLLTTAWEPVQ